MKLTDETMSKDTDTSKAPPSLAEQPSAASENKSSQYKSKGERLFNWLVYGGVSWLGVFVASIFAGHWAKYGGGAQKFKKWSEKLTGLGLKAETAEKAVLMNTALSMPGNFAVIPIKMAEDHKISIIEKLDNLLGDKTNKEALEKEPKQTWWSILKGRVVAWAVVFASFKAAGSVAGEKFDVFEKKFSENIVCKPLGKPTHVNGKETKAFEYGKIAALDFFATTMATVLLFFGSKFFARKGSDKNKEKPAPINPPAEDPKADLNLSDTTKQRSEQFAHGKSHAERLAANQALDTGSLQIGV